MKSAVPVVDSGNDAYVGRTKGRGKLNDMWFIGSLIKKKNNKSYIYGSDNSKIDALTAYREAISIPTDNENGRGLERVVPTGNQTQWLALYFANRQSPIS